MYFVCIYDYKTKECLILKKGSKYQMASYIEGYLLDYVNINQTHKINQIDEILKTKNSTIHKSEWDNNVRFFITKSNNNVKYTMIKVLKERGYIYNSYENQKLFSIYLIKEKTDAPPLKPIPVQNIEAPTKKPVYLDELKDFFEDYNNNNKDYALFDEIFSKTENFKK